METVDMAVTVKDKKKLCFQFYSYCLRQKQYMVQKKSVVELCSRRQVKGNG